MHLILRLAVICAAFGNLWCATPKYSTPVDKKILQTVPSGRVKSYAGFDFKSSPSRFGHDEHVQHSSIPHDSYYYPHHDYFSPHHYDYDRHHMLPYILGGFGILVLPLLTLMYTLAVNVAPANNIPTAVTTATGKIAESKIFLDLKKHIMEALSDRE